MCHGIRIYCEGEYNNCLSLCLAVLPEFCPLPQYPLTPETCPTFRTASPHFPPSTSFILFLNPSASWEVCIWVRDVLWMESSPYSGQTPHPHRYSPHTLWNIYFRCDFFSPLVPFLCLTCLPSLNQYGWLDNFTGSLTPKETPERESPTSCSSTYSVCSPSEALIQTLVA